MIKNQTIAKVYRKLKKSIPGSTITNFEFDEEVEMKNGTVVYKKNKVLEYVEIDEEHYYITDNIDTVVMCQTIDDNNGKVISVTVSTTDYLNDVLGFLKDRNK